MNLIPWEKLVYYQIFCFIWQKGGEQIGERGLNMTRNHLQFPVSVRLYCYLYPGAWPVALSHRNFSFSQAASEPCWAARATKFSSRRGRHVPSGGCGGWNLCFCVRQTFLAPVLLCGYHSSVELAANTDLYPLQPSRCTWALFQT